MTSWPRLSVVGVVATLLWAPAASGQTIIRVDDDAALLGDGTSWSMAYRYLQDAITGAAVAAPPVEIRIAQGTYKPDEDEGGNVTALDRFAAFQMMNDVSLRGGFAGNGEPDPDLRDTDAFDSILSGDLLGDDDPDPMGSGFLGYDENSLHVVKGGGTDETAVIDGVTITAGNADVNGTLDYRGGGVQVVGGSPTIAGCTLRLNMAGFGGGVHVENGGATISGCQINTNHAGDGGGVFVLLNDNSGPQGLHLTQCVISDNIATGSGGGMEIISSSSTIHTTVSDYAFASNTAFVGGGIQISAQAPDAIDPTFTNCLIVGNAASLDGGGIRIPNSADDWIEPTFQNCVIAGNVAGGDGGGIYTYASSNLGTISVARPYLANNVVYGNSAAGQGGGIMTEVFGAGTSTCEPTIANTVLWANLPDQVAGTGTPLISFSNVQGGYAGDGNIDVDPALVDPDGADDTIGTLDDDLRLLALSPCIDAGNNAAVRPDVSDLDGDGDDSERSPQDLDGEFRFQDDLLTPDSTCFAVDMGAFEFDGDDPEETLDFIGTPGASWFDAGSWSGASLPHCQNVIALSTLVVVDQPGAEALHISIAPGGVLQIAAGSLAVQTITIESGGQLILDDPAALLVARTINVDAGGTVDFARGEIELEAGGWAQTTGITIGDTASSQLTLVAGASVLAPTIDIGVHGTVSGNGFLAGDVTNGGRLAPGLPVGTLNVGGAYLQLSSGTLAMDIAGEFAGFSFDRLEVGSLTLDGTLEVAFVGGFEPQLDDAFRLINPTQSRETFGTIVATGLPACLTADFISDLVFAAAAPKTLFVRANATPGGDGLSWATAHDTLQSALDVACGGDEIWVTAGTYLPSAPAEAGDPRSVTFRLPAGLAIYGGFDGTEATLGERAGLFDTTVLSGDLGGNDLPPDPRDWPGDNPDLAENAYHVITASDATGVVIDGFTIRDGHANLTGEVDDRGGGLLVDVGQITVRDCFFRRNFADDSGGAVSVRGDLPFAQVFSFSNTVFEGNWSGFAGAVEVVSGGNEKLEIHDCTFTGNMARNDDGTSGTAGALSTDIGFEIVDSLFEFNEAGFSAGAMYVRNGNFNVPSVLSGCTFVGNSAGGHSGAIFQTQNLRMSGNMFTGNSAPLGAGLANRGGFGRRLHGVGNIGDGVASEDDLEPGIDGVGTARIEGDYQQYFDDPDDTGTLIVEIGGLVPGSEHDLLEVTGTATLTGLLSVPPLLPPYVPQAGDSLVIVDALSVVGRFDVAYFPSLPNDLFMRVEYGGASPGGGDVTVVIDPLPDLFGGFDLPENVPLDGLPTAAVLGDFDPGNGNGLDLALTIPGTSPPDGSVIILLNAGTDPSGWLGFAGSLQVPVGADPSAVAVGDFDGDGVADLAVTNSGDDDVSVLLNDGMASPAFARVDVAVGAGPLDVAAGEFDGAPGIDLAVANFADNTVIVLENDGGGAFTQGAMISTPGGPCSLEPEDFDDDRDDDLAVARCFASEVTIALQDNGDYSTQFAVPVGPDPRRVEAVDLDGDGDPDLVTANTAVGTISIVLNQGLGAFGAAADLPIGSNPTSIAALDLEPDGDLDLAVVVDDDGGEPIVQILRNDLSGSVLQFAAAQEFESGFGPALVVAGDVDDDNVDDLLAVNGGAAAAPFGPPAPFVQPLVNLSASCPADLNADGAVGFSDLLQLLAVWGPCPACPEDLDGNGSVAFADLLALLSAWGPCE